MTPLGYPGKRWLDVLLASGALIALSPLLLGCAVAVRLDSAGPALFRQSRVGAAGRRFSILKFRSMAAGTADVASAEAATLEITRVGRVLRRTNIDELPQLVNIVRGDMSVVGPRPALPAQAELLALREARGADRLRPGLTGLAQIRAYDGMPNERKAAFDAEYAERASLGLDLTIILRTVGYLRRRPPTY